jgi:pimeloyl-ACP methyl ester carboxylesterase
MLINEYGGGRKTIILIHGGPSLFGYMKSLGTRLSHKYKIIDYAQKGTYESPATQAQLSVQSHIEDLKNIIANNNESPIILIGHSWGANLSLLTVAKYQGIVERVICIGTAPLEQRLGKNFGDNIQSRLGQLDRKRLDEIEIRFEQANSVEEKNSIMQERLKITAAAYHLDPATELSVPKSRWNFHSFEFSIDSIWDLIEGQKIPALLSKITDPVTAFHGDADPIPQEETFNFLESHIKGIRTIKVSQAGHFPWLEITSRDQFFVMLQNEL